METIRLDRLIFRHYSKSALFPILFIEVMLLVLYFAINSYTNKKTESSMRKEVQSVMPHLARQQAQAINANFHLINRQTAYFARTNAELLAHPELYNIPGEQPRFALSPDNALYQTNLAEGSSLFYPRGNTLSAAQREKALRTAALNPLYRHLVKDIPHVAAAYLNTPDDMNRIYPFIPDVYKQYPADLNMEAYNFYYLADEKHNPAKKTVWTGVYLDPAGQGWMLSCIAPVYVGKSLAGVVGLDVTTKTIVNNILRMDLPWQASAFLADKDGMILAMSPKAEKVFGLKELKDHVYSAAISREQQKPEDFNLFKNRDRKIADSFRKIYDSAEQLHYVKTGAESVFVVQDRIAETGWRLFILVEPDIVFAEVKANATVAKNIGYGVILLMALFYLAFFIVLRKKAGEMSDTIARPLTLLAAATSRIGSGEGNTAISLSGVSEIDALTDNFNKMNVELEDRSRKLIEHEVKIKMQEKDVELAYAQGMFEAASGYLHNIGNSIAALDSNMMDLREIVKSTEQYPIVFKKLRDESDPAVLSRFEDVLVNRTAPKLAAGIERIDRIRETIRQTIAFQQQSFRESRESLAPADVNLSELARQLLAEFARKYDGIKFSESIQGGIVIKNYRIQMLNGIANVLKNAVDACGEKGNISLALVRTDNLTTLTVTDDGCGIAPEDLPRIMTAGFTTKPEGHGLGLHSFAVFLSAQGHSMKIYSEGVNRGARTVIEVKNA